MNSPETLTRLLQRGTVEEIAQALRADPQLLTRRQEGGRTVLHLAAAVNRADVVSALVRLGADVTARDDRGWTPLHDAAKRHGWKCAEALLAAGASWNTPGSLGTPAMVAMGGNQGASDRPKTLSKLCALGLHPTVHEYVCAGMSESIRECLRDDPRAPLAATMPGRLAYDAVFTLERKTVDLLDTELDDHEERLRPEMDWFEALVASGIPLEEDPTLGVSAPLFYAIQMPNPRAAEILLRHGASGSGLWVMAGRMRGPERQKLLARYGFGPK